MADGHKGRALQEDRNVRLIVKSSIGAQYKSAKVGTCQCREGLYALPKKMFDLFLSKRLDHFSAVGSFSVEGHEALPCTGYASPYIT